MPYNNKTKTKVTYRKKKGYRSASSYGGKSIYAMAKAFAAPGAEVATAYLKKALGLNTEVKYADFAEAAGTATTTTLSAIGSFLPIPQGDSTNQRQGNGLRVTSLNACYTFRANTASIASSRVRLICMVQPKLNTAGAIFTAADIVTDTTANVETPYNMNTVGYNIIFDKTFEIAAVGQTGSTKEINIRYNPLQHHMEWIDSDTAGTATNLLKGYIRCFVCTDNGTHPPTYSSYSRLKWVDN